MKPIHAWIITVSVAVIALVHVIFLVVTLKDRHDATRQLMELRSQM
jgi:hypothetical protein